MRHHKSAENEIIRRCGIDKRDFDARRKTRVRPVKNADPSLFRTTGRIFLRTASGDPHAPRLFIRRRIHAPNPPRPFASQLRREQRRIRESGAAAEKEDVQCDLERQEPRRVASHARLRIDERAVMMRGNSSHENAEPAKRLSGTA
ncbi:hypothetical protein [Burkholderia sp. ABCPW 14]|uniref:hypothetical protein n=1 Tax=Burkholderia sp. ABCPW 14 TaxID=1637860 RepID=UPI0012E38DC1|nr:hypothetical protein [Burkholderia sp. ABCPW 14]